MYLKYNNKEIHTSLYIAMQIVLAIRNRYPHTYVQYEYLFNGFYGISSHTALQTFEDITVLYAEHFV